VKLAGNVVLLDVERLRVAEAEEQGGDTGGEGVEGACV